MSRSRRQDSTPSPTPAPASGERATLEACYRQFGYRIHARSLQILGDEQAASDVTQEVFVRLAESLDDFRRESNIATWIYVITTRQALQWLRSNRRRAAREEEYSRGKSATLASAEARLAAAEEIRRAVREVPDDILEVASLYFIDQLSQVEIAALHGISRRTVVRQINRFREFMARDSGIESRRAP